MLLIFFSMILFAGCATSAENPQSGHTNQPSLSAAQPAIFQIIIKFRADSLDPSQPDFLAKLSSDAGASLTYLRPTSGGAHVFKFIRTSDPDKIADILKNLQKRSDIIYAEPDRLLQHQIR